MFVDGMIRHHQGAIQMAKTEIDEGKNKDPINMTKQIATTQQQEIETMQALLSQI
jgi:uncharacterized protein (DUF305 family)